ncbi:hypothetical protein [Photobacterium leiognathi]|uniref:hypothetical protein n=1 Tax=Photobacterium leiognathi TaxID=553611 RepID=UPI002981D8A3|nr:hypothetical protein [Photobacterium leiognathi]
MNKNNTELDRLCAEVISLTSSSESQSKIGLASAIYALTELFNKNNNPLGHAGFVELIRRSGLSDFTMKYQTFRYNCNLGYLYEFADRKLFCNCLRRGSEAKTKLQKLDLPSQDFVRDLISKQAFVTIRQVEEFICAASNDRADNQNNTKQKVEQLQSVIAGLFPALHNMVVYSDEMPRNFYVNFTEEMAEQVWLESIKEKPGNMQRLLLVNLQTLFFSLIDISAVLLDNRELVYIRRLTSRSDIYRDIPVDSNIPDVLIALKREFLAMFKQEQLQMVCNELLKDLTDRKALFEYMTARNVMRTKPELALAFREFY